MTSIHPELLWWGLAGVVPVILHFLLRAKPKPLVFPALRLIQQRRRQNVQRMRLRHIWLMLLRIAALLLLVAAAARLRVPAADYAPTWGESLTFLGILALAAGVYAGLLWQWRRRDLPAHAFQYRRSLLRAGVGTGVCLLTLLLVLWPFQRRVWGALSNPEAPVGTNLPVAAVFLFDNSLSMQYRFESHTRLEVARGIAEQHLRQLPARSRLAVADLSSEGPLLFLTDHAAARVRMEAIEPQPHSETLSSRLRTALELQAQDVQRTAAPGDGGAPQDNYVREIYLFTDLAASGWRLEDGPRLRELLEAQPAVSVYVIDVGLTDPQNTALGTVQLSETTLSVGANLIVRVPVAATGLPAGARNVALFIKGPGDALVKQGQTEVPVDPATQGLAEFSVRGLTGPVAQGEIRLVEGDALPFDDVRYFSVDVRPPPELLVVSDVKADAQYWIEALAPAELARVGKIRYRCVWRRPPQLNDEELNRYSAVCLLNVDRLRRETWTKLRAYAEAGGGVFVALGSEVDPVSYGATEALGVLPARLKGHVRFLPPEFLDLRQVDHPLLKKFADWGVADFASVEILRYWRVEPQADAAVGTIVSYTDPSRAPALLERPLGRGRVLLFTTSLSRNGWNDLPTVWSYLAFADQTIRYLSRARDETLQLLPGDAARLSLPADERLTAYLLRKPNQQQTRHELDAGDSALTIRPLDQVGHYRVLGAEAGSTFDRGFSVNARPAESVLTRLTQTELDELLGVKRYRLARTMEELDRTVRTGRIGVEIFPWVLTAMLLVFVGELTLANRFYDDQRPATANQGARGQV